MAQYVYSGETSGSVSFSGALPAGTNNIGDVDVASVAAGDNNIGNVDVVTLPALPAGTNAIGKLAANSGVDIGDVDVTSLPQPTAPSTPFNNKTTVTTAGTRVALGASQALTIGVWIRAATTNTGLIYVGDSSVSASNGYELAPGEAQFFPIANRATINIDASANSQSVTYYAV